MSTDPIDKQMDALEFENLRLSFTPARIALLVTQIGELESRPLDPRTKCDLKAELQRLDDLKQHLASLRQLIRLLQALPEGIDRMLAVYWAQLRGRVSPDKGADEVVDGIHA